MKVYGLQGFRVQGVGPKKGLLLLPPFLQGASRPDAVHHRSSGYNLELVGPGRSDTNHVVLQVRLVERGKTSGRADDNLEQEAEFIFSAS